MNKYFFYYVRVEQTGQIQPRVCCEWPPIGKERNEVIAKCEITAEQAEYSLADLERMYHEGKL